MIFSAGMQMDNTFQEKFFGLSFLVATLYMPGVISPSLIPKMALLSFAIPVWLWLSPGRPRWNTLNVTLAALLLYAFASIFWAFSKEETVPGLWELCIFAGCCLLGQALEGHTFTKALQWFAYGLCISLVVEAGQYLDPKSWAGWFPTIDGYPSGLFVNGRMLGEILGLAGAGLIAIDFPLACVFLVGIFFAGSRNGALAMIVAGAMWVYPRRTWNRLVTMGVVVMSAAGFAWMGFLSVDRLTSGRFDLWSDTIRGITPWGRGIGNFYVAFPQFAHIWNPLSPARPEQAHNEILHYAFELGYPGALLIGIILWYCISKRKTPEISSQDATLSKQSAGLVATAFAVECLFGFPLHLPGSIFLGGLALGHLARYSDPVWDPLRLLHSRKSSHLPVANVRPDCGLPVAIRQDGIG